MIKRISDQTVLSQAVMVAIHHESDEKGRKFESLKQWNPDIYKSNQRIPKFVKFILHSIKVRLCFKLAFPVIKLVKTR